MKCRYHPEEDAVAVCQKFGHGYCRKCCDKSDKGTACICPDPNVHCKYRSECLVNYLSKNHD
ncbi:MAG: hypothetical protein SVZ03_13560 [Spirochaetota bacterium]|nr:hypothetical protein [Spirochaetota bacterium]